MISCLSHAKINLHLHMTGRAENGYHTLDSLVAFTNLTDTVQISTASEYSLGLHGDFQDELQSSSSLSDNLVTRAVMALASYYGRQPHMRIDLTKSIPLGAGLGGGSANAATTLKSVCAFWGIPIEYDVLHKIAGHMGSDIAACLSDGPVIMRDTGNTLLPAPRLPVLSAMLVNPRTPCPTPLVYKAYASMGTPFSEDVVFPNAFVNAHDVYDFLNTHTANDLTSAAIIVNPDVKAVLGQLAALPDCKLARLSGSGSTCFALFDTSAIAAQARDIIQKQNPDWWVRVVEIGQN